MAHFAKVLDGVVQNVIRCELDVLDISDDTPGEWIQTSYNTRGNVHYAPDSSIPDGGIALRGNYAGIGHLYDETNDVFYPPKPYDSWIISADTNWIWTPPVPYPDDGKFYGWDEPSISWVVLADNHPENKEFILDLDINVTYIS
jgi:hypothetical protein